MHYRCPGRIIVGLSRVGVGVGRNVLVLRWADGPGLMFTALRCDYMYARIFLPASRRPGFPRMRARLRLTVMDTGRIDGVIGEAWKVHGRVEEGWARMFMVGRARGSPACPAFCRFLSRYFWFAMRDGYCMLVCVCGVCTVIQYEFCVYTDSLGNPLFLDWISASFMISVDLTSYWVSTFIFT